MGNREEINRALDNLDEFEIAVLRERILTVTEYVMSNKESITEQMNKDGFISPALYIQACEHIFNEFNFAEENGTDTN